MIKNNLKIKKYRHEKYFSLETLISVFYFFGFIYFI